MLKIGLTGGIGSGKSLAGAFFNDLGVITIDADRVAQQITSPGTDFFSSILSHFGPDFLTDDNQLDRKKLRELIFNSPHERQWLEDLLHPAIRATLNEQINISNAPYVIAIIPLLTRTSKLSFIDRTLLIDAPIELQIERAMQRDSMTKEQALKIIHAQSSREEKIAIADDIITNNNNLDDLKYKVSEMHSFYLSLAHSSKDK